MITRAEASRKAVSRQARAAGVAVPVRGAGEEIEILRDPLIFRPGS